MTIQNNLSQMIYPSDKIKGTIEEMKNEMRDEMIKMVKKTKYK